MQTKHHWPLGFSSNSPVLWPRTISWGGDEMGNSVMHHVTPSCDLTEGGRWSENSLTIEDINVKKSKFIRSSNFFDVMRYHHIQYLTFLMFFVWKSNLRGQWIWWIRNPATLFVFSKKKHNRTAYLWRDAMCLQDLCLGVKSDHWWGMHFSNVGKKSVKYTSLQMVVYVWGFPKRPLDLLKITLLSWEAWHVTTIFDWEDSILKVVQWNTDGQCLLMLLKYRGHLQWCFGLWLCGWTTFILNPSTERIWKDIQ